MAVDKLVDSTQLDADLTSVANTIRTKGGTSAPLAFPAGFVNAINAIPTGGSGLEPEIELLDTITITEPVSLVVWDIPASINKFYEIWLIGNVNLSVTDWLYVGIDTIISSTASYTAKADSIDLALHITAAIRKTVNDILISGVGAGTGFTGSNRVTTINSDTLSRINIFPYSNSTTITNGTINIYGRGW